MKRRDLTAIVLFVAIVMIGSALFGQSVQVPDAVRRASRGAVGVQAGSAGGSGCQIFMGYPNSEHKHIHVLTNRHVIEGGGPYSIEFQGSDKHFPATLMTVASDADIAYLKVERTAETDRLAYPIPIARQNPTTGTRFYWIGFSYRGPLAFTGQVERRMNASTLLCRGYSVSGQSGCPAFNDSGELIGVNWGYTGNQDACCMVDLAKVKTLTVAKYGYAPLQQSLAPVTFPEVMQDGRETQPVQPRFQQIDIRAPGVGIQIPQQYQQPIMIPIQQPIPRTPIQIGDGLANIPYRIFIEFDPGVIDLQKQFIIRPQIQQLLEQRLQQPIQVQPQQLPQLQAPRIQTQPLGCGIQ